MSHRVQDNGVRQIRQGVGVCGARPRLNLHGPHEPRLGSALNQLSIIPHGSGPMPDGVEVEPIGRVENLNWGPRAIEVSATVVPDLVDTTGTRIFHDPADRGGVGLPVSRARRGVSRSGT